MDAATVVTSSLGAVGGLGGVATLATAFIRRKKVKADAAETVTDTALELMTALKADARAAREDLAATRSELASVRVEAESLAGRLRGLVAAIHNPIMTIEVLRGMVPISSGTNGSGH